VEFEEIFQEFLDHRKQLKVIFVASCDEKGEPNSAPKMLVDTVKPDQVYYLDHKFTQTYTNITKNRRASLSFMDEPIFTGYRLTGTCQILDSGKDYEMAKEIWRKRLISYEAARMIDRIRGGFSAREAENVLPEDFVIVKLTAKEAAVVKPDRVLRALH